MNKEKIPSSTSNHINNSHMAPLHSYTDLPVETVKPGLFSSERTVQIKLNSGKLVSLFADERLLKVEGGKTTLRIYIADRNNAAHTTTVLLPSEAFETQSRWAVVPMV